MAHKAACKLCCCLDDTVIVVCTKQCIICSRCQLNPVIRKMLIECTIPMDTSIKANWHKLTGTCPVCSSRMTDPMLSAIIKYKETMNINTPSNTNTDGDGSMGRCMGGIELEESPILIQSFVKRFKTTYDQPPVKKPGAAAVVVASISSPSLPNVSIGNNAIPNSDDVYELFAVSKKLSAMKVFDFIQDCYVAQWGVILRNAKDSMVPTIFRLFQRKKFSTRTNDLRAKSFLDYFASPSGGETPDFLLFGRLLGLQPYQTSTISPAWSHITTSIMAIVYCDRCMKTGCIIDVSGNPTLNEFAGKLDRQVQQGNGVMVSQSVNILKRISFKKALKAIDILSSTSQPHWVMSPMIPICIEYGAKLPWDKTSISKLLTILLFLVLSDELNSNHSSKHHVNTRPKRDDDNHISIASDGLTPFLPPIAKTNIANTETTFMTASTTSTTTNQQQQHDSELLTMAASSMVDNNNNNTNSYTSSSSYIPQDNNRTAIVSPTRMHFLRTIDDFISKVWSSSVHRDLSRSDATINDKIEYLMHLSEHSTIKYVPVTIDEAYKLIRSKDSMFLSELSYICIKCWDFEYKLIKSLIEKAKFTFKRRTAISGCYDTKQAEMNAADRLCLIRLMHWYSVDDEMLPIDWDEVIEKSKERLFPFAVPDSLVSKSINELNHLERVVKQDKVEQKIKDDFEDKKLKSTGQGILETKKRLRAEKKLEELSIADIEKEQRGQYLSTQQLGYADVPVSTDKPSTIIRMGSLPNMRSSHLFFNGEDEEEESDTVSPLESPRFMKDDEFNEVLTKMRDISGLDLTSANDTGHTLGGMTRPLSPVGNTSTDMIKSNSLSQLGRINKSRGGDDHLIQPSDEYKEMMMFHSKSTFIARSADVFESSTSHEKKDLPDNVDGDLLVNIGKDDPDKNYVSVIQSYRESRIRDARNRVLNRSIIRDRVNNYDSNSDSSSVVTGILYYTQSSDSSVREEINVNDMDKDMMIDANNMPMTEKSKIQLRVYRMNRLMNNAPLRRIQVLNMNKYISTKGDVMIDLVTHLSSQSAVFIFILRNETLSFHVLQSIADNYFKPWQFHYLIRIDLSQVKLGSTGALILSEKFSKAHVQVIHLNLNGCKLTGRGLKLILTGLIQGKGAGDLIRLDLQDNDLFLSGDSVNLLRHFTSMRSLDLSQNSFTLDTSSQVESLRAGLCALSELQSLSIAHNKIQDHGAEAFFKIVQMSFPKLEILDMSACFLTKHVFQLLDNLLEPNDMSETDDFEVRIKESRSTTISQHNNSINDNYNNKNSNNSIVKEKSTEKSIDAGQETFTVSFTNPELMEILLNQNLLTVGYYHDYIGNKVAEKKIQSRNRSRNYLSDKLGVDASQSINSNDAPVSNLLKTRCKIYYSGEANMGISIPLRYDLRDYGIDDYMT